VHELIMSTIIAKLIVPELAMRELAARIGAVGAA
jgi:hypothetical protein